MRISRHGDHLVQLTSYPAVFPMNCYLVIEGDGLTLVDSTMSSPADAVARVAGELGLQLRRVVLTHAHGDHVGGVAGVRERFTDLVISIGEREARLLAFLSAKLLSGDVPDRVLDEFVQVLLEPLGLASCQVSVTLDGQEIEAKAVRAGVPRGGPTEVIPVERLRIPPERLAAAFRAVLERLSDAEPMPVAVTYSVEGKVALLRERLARGPLDFEELFAGVASRLEAVACFLALLEMLKRGEATVEQRNAYGPITVTARG